MPYVHFIPKFTMVTVIVSWTYVFILESCSFELSGARSESLQVLLIAYRAHYFLALLQRINNRSVTVEVGSWTVDTNWIFFKFHQVKWNN